MTNKIKRVSNTQKRIINRILESGLADYQFNNCDIVMHTAIEFLVSEEDVIACIEYVEDKFYFWNVHSN